MSSTHFSCLSASLTWTLDLLSGVAAAEDGTGGVATEDIIDRLVFLRTDVVVVVLLAAELATLLLLLPLGRPVGTTKAPADEAPQHKAPMIANADFMAKN